MSVFIVSHKKLEETPPSGYRIMYVGGNADRFAERIYEETDGRTSDNISSKNASYCELTALYAIYRMAEQCSDEIYGLVHYRRRFLSRMKPFHNDLISRMNGMGFYRVAARIADHSMLKEDRIAEIFESGADVILPRKRHFENNMAVQYAECHVLSDLSVVRDVIQERHPDYLFPFDAYMFNHESYFYNMIIARGGVLTAYCKWLFDILFEVEKRIITTGRDPYQSRVFGFLSERLLNVYFIKNSHLRKRELPVAAFDNNRDATRVKIVC